MEKLRAGSSHAAAATLPVWTHTGRHVIYWYFENKLCYSENPSFGMSFVSISVPVVSARHSELRDVKRKYSVNMDLFVYLLYFGESMLLKHATSASVCTVTAKEEVEFQSRFMDIYRILVDGIRKCFGQTFCAPSHNSGEPNTL